MPGSQYQSSLKLIAASAVSSGSGSIATLTGTINVGSAGTAWVCHISDANGDGTPDNNYATSPDVFTIT